MDIQVNTDSHVAGREALADHIPTMITTRLARFDNDLTRVEVHLAEESAGRTTAADKRCRIEARPAGRQPVAVTSHGATLDQACSEAIGKLATLLTRELGRRDHHKGSESIRTGSSGEDAQQEAAGDRSQAASPSADPDAPQG